MNHCCGSGCQHVRFNFTCFISGVPEEEESASPLNAKSYKNLEKGICCKFTLGAGISMPQRRPWCRRVVYDFCYGYGGSCIVCRVRAKRTALHQHRKIQSTFHHSLVRYQTQHKNHQFDDFIQKIASDSYASHFKSLLLLMLLLLPISNARVKL